jgi:tRNA uridine 5-carbamoylmethylation protein Kti12
MNFEDLRCQDGYRFQAKTTPDYIASSLFKQSKCYDHDKPIIIETNSGQSINITLIDFAWSKRSIIKSTKSCNALYGHLMTVNTDVIEICGTNRREQHIHLSNSHQIQIVLQREALKEVQFILKFEGICLKLLHYYYDF